MREKCSQTQSLSLLTDENLSNVSVFVFMLGPKVCAWSFVTPESKNPFNKSMKHKRDRIRQHPRKEKVRSQHRSAKESMTKAAR